MPSLMKPEYLNIILLFAPWKVNKAMSNLYICKICKYALRRLLLKSTTV